MSNLRQIWARCRPAVALSMKPLPSVAAHHKAHIGIKTSAIPSAFQSHLQCVTAAFHTSGSVCNQHIVNIQDEEDFKKQVIDSAVPVIVDFHASWCGPCKLLGPRLETIVAAKNGGVILAKVDIDELTDIAMEHQVTAVPTVLGMKGGKVLDTFIGVKDDEELHSFVNKLTGE